MKLLYRVWKPTMMFLDYQNVLKISEDTYLPTTRYYIVDTDTTKYNTWNKH